MKQLLALLLCLFFTVTSAFSAAAPVGVEREYLIVSGGPALLKWEKFKNPPHDLWWMNFIRAARIRIQQLQAEGVPAKNITWFVYKPGYVTRSKQEGQDLIANIVSVRDAYGIDLQFFNRTEELIQHINAGKPRNRVKIANFEYFGHSNKACFLFDYSNIIDSSSKVWLHEDDLGRLSRNSFTRDAFVKSWGCHTGQSMSQKFRDFTGLKMWGATVRSQYMTHELPTLANSTGRWVY